MSNLETLLKTIKVVNGFRTNIGETVIYYYGSVDEGVDHVVFADEDETYDKKNMQLFNTLQCNIQVVRYGNNYGLLANETISDLKKLIVANRKLGLTGPVETRLVSSQVDREDTGRDFVVIQMQLSIEYAE